MSLVFSAITPHPPLLIPTIGKDNIKKVEKTKLALEKLEEDLYLSRPDTIIVISPHGHLLTDAFTINYCAEYETDLRDFGDLTTKLKFKGEITLPFLFNEACKDRDCRLAMVSERALDHGIAVPLFFLSQHLPNATVIPVGYSFLGWKEHFEFGTLLQEQIMKTNKRVAVIASGDLSHALTSDAPAGFNTAGPEFDAKIQEILSTRNTTGMLQLDANMVESAAECGFRSFLILMGILRDINYKYESYSYEAPFGVGYLTANLVL